MLTTTISSVSAGKALVVTPSQVTAEPDGRVCAEAQLAQYLISVFEYVPNMDWIRDGSVVVR